MPFVDDNKLKKIHDSRQISAILLTSKEKQHPVFVWRIIGDKKILAEVQLDLILSARGEIRITPKAECKEAFEHVVGGCTSINFFLPHSSTLFQTQYKSSHREHGIATTFPEFVAQMERRRWLRMGADNQARLRIQFTKKATYPRPMNQFFSKALSDMGAGGVSFLVSKHELRFLVEGDELKDLELLVEGQKIKVNARVKRTYELTRHSYSPSVGKVYKVSLQFEAIERKDQETLAKFIFQNVVISSEAV